MKKNRKIGLIVTPIVIVVIISLIQISSDNSISLPIQNEPEIPAIESTSIDLSSLNSPIIGWLDAPVTIIAFNDYQCASCKTWYQNEYPTIFKNLIETQKANIMFIDSNPTGNDSVLISEATFCADDQDKYSDYQQILFDSQQNIDEWTSSEQLKKFAMEIELNQELFDGCLDSGKHQDTILSNIEFSKNFGVSQIPLFKIINFEGKEHLLKGGLSSRVFEETVNRFQ